MEKIGYILLAIVAVVWLVTIVAGMVAGMIVSFPVGIIGLVAIIGIGLLLAQVIKDRLTNKEDHHYSKTVEK